MQGHNLNKNTLINYLTKMRHVTFLVFALAKL